MSTANGLRAGDAIALPVDGELRLMRVITAIDESLVMADEGDLRRRVVVMPRLEVEARGERARC